MSQAKEADSAPASKLLSYLRLLRLPNVFTAMADIAMGFLFAKALQPIAVDVEGPPVAWWLAFFVESFSPLQSFTCLLLASCSLYTAGMVLNDVYDFEVDSRERPQRPLPSGQISLGQARLLGYSLLLLGVGLAWLAGYVHGDAETPWRSGVVGTLLATCVVLYDAVLKKTFVGPVAMGACRFFNLLLGMSVGATTVENFPALLGYDFSALAVAGGIGLYIVGVTWFARREAAESSQLQLGMSVLVMVAGLLLLGMFAAVGDGHQRLNATAQRNEFIWPLLLLLLSVTIVRRCGTAVTNPTSERVQAAVKQCIVSLIILNAAVVLVVGDSPILAIAVLALLVPMLIMGKWVYST